MVGGIYYILPVFVHKCRKHRRWGSVSPIPLSILAPGGSRRHKILETRLGGFHGPLVGFAVLGLPCALCCYYPTTLCFFKPQIPSKSMISVSKLGGDLRAISLRWCSHKPPRGARVSKRMAIDTDSPSLRAASCFTPHLTAPTRSSSFLGNCSKRGVLARLFVAVAVAHKASNFSIIPWCRVLLPASLYSLHLVAVFPVTLSALLPPPTRTTPVTNMPFRTPFSGYCFTMIVQQATAMRSQGAPNG